MLTKHECNLKAVGWARRVSGFQSLLSVYLIALWVLSYFGRPFGSVDCVETWSRSHPYVQQVGSPTRFGSGLSATENGHDLRTLP